MARRAATVKVRREPAGLSRDRVCNEALALVDQEGLAALSMRRLGARLGVEGMSLYRHVRNKDDLLDALHAAVLGDLQPAGEVAEGDWRALLAGLASALRAALLRHPNVVALFATRPVNAPAAMVPIERVRAALEEARFAPEHIGKAIVAVGVFTIGHVLGEILGEQSTLPGSPSQPGEEEFRFGLDALLDGMGKHAGKRKGKV
jgi:AcrR family transcriptional regulator